MTVKQAKKLVKAATRAPLGVKPLHERDLVEFTDKEKDYIGGLEGCHETPSDETVRYMKYCNVMGGASFEEFQKAVQLAEAAGEGILGAAAEGRK